jgi:hypothetical protein
VVNAAATLPNVTNMAVNAGLQAAGVPYRFRTDLGMKANGSTESAAEWGSRTAVGLIPVAKLAQGAKAAMSAGEMAQQVLAKAVTSGAAQEAQHVTAAIADTIITPTPGLGHSKLGDAAATALWAGFNYFSVM